MRFEVLKDEEDEEKEEKVDEELAIDS